MTERVFDANGWCHDMSAAPRDGTDLLLWFDHGADPYHIEETGKLTDYAAWAESGDFLDGKGLCIGRWFEQFWESVDEYGSGYWLPAAWFALEYNDYERVVNAIAWQPRPLPPVKEQGQ